VHAPDERGPWPVVVTVHGGGWYIGDRLSMGLLADGLAARDAVVFNTSYRTVSEGGSFPSTVDEIACAVSYARAHAAEYTTTPERVVIVGHSAGAHLAAVVATAPGEFGGACGAPSVVDGFVGLAGPYDISRFSGLLLPFFGVSILEDPETWSAGNPLDRAATAPDIPYLLLHGDLDELVPVGFSEDFAEALEQEGLDVTFEVIPGADHGVLNAPVVVADRIIEFAALSSSGTP
jgi:acetyl esterase/lipase